MQYDWFMELGPLNILKEEMQREYGKY
jgi:hypothetical protein